MSSGIDGILVDTYNYLVSVKNTNASVKTKTGTQSLKGATDSNIIPLDQYNGTGNSASNLYWIDTDGEIGITSHVSGNDIIVFSLPMDPMIFQNQKETTAKKYILFF